MIGGISSSGGVRTPKKRSKPRGSNCVRLSEDLSVDTRVEIADADIIGTNDFSFCFWYKRPSYLGAFQTSGQNPRMFVQAANKSNVASLSVGEVSGVTGSCLDFNVFISNSTIISLESNTHGMSLDTWHHIAVVCDRSSASNSKIYVDGVALTMETQTMDSSTDIDIGGIFTLGGNAATSGGFYKDLMFYSRALGVKDISKIYNHKGRKRLLSISQLKTNLEFYLPLGDAPGDHATNSDGLLDISGNGRHGTGVENSGTLTIHSDSPS
jgi:hypothetical protein